MKVWWSQLAQRIDTLSLRERVFLLLSVVVLLVALADVLWFAPAQASYQQGQQRLQAQTAEVNRLRAELALSAKPVDANADLRARIVQLQTRTTELQAQLQTLAPGERGSSAGLERALRELLRSSAGVRLVSSGTMPRNGPTDAGVAGVQRHDFQLKVQGTYADLQRYVKNLEQSLPRLRWGGMQLQVHATAPQMPELTMQVYVLEVQP